MGESLEVAEGQKAEDVYARFDNELGVPAWGTPTTLMREADPVDDDAPLWWRGDEDAAQSFLMSQGVILPDAG
jgi:hypothetical protein